MAKKFVKVTGLNKVFGSIDSSGNATIKTDVSVADSNSILFIEATNGDSSFSSPYNVAGSRWIWAQGKLYDANTPLFQKLTSLSDSSNESINDNDSVELILRKLKYQVEAASKAGVQSLTSNTDNWITVDPKLDQSTGAVNLSIGHAAAGEVSTSISANISINNVEDNLKINYKIPQIHVDSKGHFVVVQDSSTTTSTITLDACEGSMVHFKCDNNKLYAEINTNGYTAYKKGDASNNVVLTKNASSFKIIDLSTDIYGFARNSNEAIVTLPETAFADTSYEFVSGIQSFSYKVKGTNESITVGVSHMAQGTGNASASDGTYISDVCIDKYGHVTAVASKSNGVYSDDATSHANSELAVWDGNTNKLKTSYTTIRSSSIAADNSTTTIPTTAQVIDYVAANKVSGAMTYKSTFSGKFPDEPSTGDTYVLDVNADISFGGKKTSCQIGDMFIYNGSIWDRIPAGDTTVENKDATITESSTTLAVIDGITISAKVNVASTSKKGIVQLSDSTSTEESSTAATSKAVYDVSQAAHKVKFDGSIGSTSDGSYILGSFTNANGSSTIIYGQDTKYVHPTVSSDASKAVSTSSGAASAKTVITSVYIDASGHVGKVETSDISAAYNKRAVKVNNNSLIESNADTALDISAGTNVTLTASASEGRVTIAASDEKVKSTTIGTSSTAYLLATTTSSESTETAVKNVSVTINGNGKLSAVSLYEGSWSIHDSSAGDWAIIE